MNGIPNPLATYWQQKIGKPISDGEYRESEYSVPNRPYKTV